MFLAEQSIRIENKSTQEVWPYVLSFIEQRKWSPWLTVDSNCKLELRGEDSQLGTVESWSSDIIGEGEQELVNIVEGELVDYSLRSTKPFKTRGRSYIALQKCGSTCTTVIWGLEGNLPWYMGFMKKKIQATIEADYTRGLNMLKYLAETGIDPTHIQTHGIVEHEETFTLGIERISTKSELPEQMKKDFSILGKFVESHRTGAHGARTYYTHVDMKKDIFTYRSSILLSKDEFLELDEEKLHDDIKKYYYLAGKTYSIRMVGSYRFMENAWNAIFMHMGVKKLKMNTKMPTFEDYINDPSVTQDHKSITDICVYVK